MTVFRSMQLMAYAIFGAPGVLAVPGALAQAPAPASYSDWQEQKKKDAAKEQAKVAKQSKMAAVDKVVAMLKDLKAQVLQEGEVEAKAYDKFACFCKSTIAEKTKAISDGKDEKETITADMNKLASARENLDTTIAGLNSDISTAEKDMKKAQTERLATLEIYQVNEADLAGAISALEGAIKTLKASKAPTLLQMQQLGETLRTAVLIADSLGVGGGAASKMVAMFAQQPDVPTEDYKFHSDSIIDTLEKLLVDFRAQKKQLDEDEVKSVSAHEMFVQEKTDFVNNKTTELDVAKKTKGERISAISLKSGELTTVAATLLDDQQYLTELSKMCSDKAKTWDQRSQMRQDELSALAAATEIIKGTVTDKTTSATVRFAQASARVRRAEATVTSEDAMEAVEADAENFEAGSSGPLSFLQRTRLRGNRQPVASQGDAGRKVVLELIRSKGQELQSSLLITLAGEIAADPLAKVKQLIQELIERLLKQAANEATQKGWCTKAISDAEQKRGYAAEEVKSLNGVMATSEALRDKLTEELAMLQKEIADLNTEKAEAERMRAEEKATNANVVAEAKDGITALDQAIDILSKYYKTAAKAKVELSLSQQTPGQDAPDTGFAAGEAYTGAQGEAGGVLGLLDVIKSDFQRTVIETEQAEASAEEDFKEFLVETGKSLAEKDVATTQKSSQKDETLSKLSSAEESLSSQMDLLKNSIKELLELKPACIDTGMSYSERVARREEEVAALKKALCILGQYTAYGVGGAGAEC